MSLSQGAVLGVIFRAFKRKITRMTEGSPKWGPSGDYQEIHFLCNPPFPVLWGTEGWSCPGDQLQRNITTLGPHGVAVDTVAEGAGKLVIIYMYLPSNWHVVAGSCVGATAMGIKEGVCQGVFVCAHEGICSL